MKPGADIENPRRAAFAIGTRVTITDAQHPWHSYSGRILCPFTRARSWIVELDNGMRPTVYEREMVASATGGGPQTAATEKP